MFIRQQQPQRRCLAMAIVAGLAVSAAAFSASAQSTTQDAADTSDTKPVQTLDKVEVTGSRIKRAEIEGPSPVVMITAEDIKKQGYSTIAEVYQNRIPFAFVSRSGFREARPLAEYILAHLPAVEIPEADFRRMDWLDRLPALLSLPRPAAPVTNGADQIAQFLCENLPNQPV